jgi:hypothetical protein
MAWKSVSCLLRRPKVIPEQLRAPHPVAAVLIALAHPQDRFKAAAVQLCRKPKTASSFLSCFLMRLSGAACLGNTNISHRKYSEGNEALVSALLFAPMFDGSISAPTSPSKPSSVSGNNNQRIFIHKWQNACASQLSQILFSSSSSCHLS